MATNQLPNEISPTDVKLSAKAPMVQRFNELMFISRPPEMQEAELEIMELFVKNPSAKTIYTAQDKKDMSDAKKAIEVLKSDKLSLQKSRRLQHKTAAVRKKAQADLDAILAKIEEKKLILARKPIERPSYIKYDQATLDRYIEIYQQGPTKIHQALQELYDVMRPNYLYLIEYKIFNTIHTIYLNQHSVFGMPDDQTSLSYILQTTLYGQDITGTAKREGSGIEYIYSIVFDHGELLAIFKRKGGTNPQTGMPTREQVGGIFPYFNNSNYDLTRYQIISHRTQIHMCVEHCILYALGYIGITEEQYERIGYIVHTALFPKRHLDKIARIINCNIDLHFMQSNTHNGKADITEKIVTYPKKKDDRYKTTCHLALFKKHYFIYEKQACNTNKSSLRLVYKLDEMGKFNSAFDKKLEIDENGDPHYPSNWGVEPTTFHEIYAFCNQKMKDTPVSTLQQQPMKTKESKQKINLDEAAIFFGDIESTVNNLITIREKSRDVDVFAAHKGCLYAFVDQSGENYVVCRSFGGMLEEMATVAKQLRKKQAIAYFHNLRYDFKIMSADPNIEFTNYVCKDGMLYSVDLKVRRFNIQLRDSWKLLSSPLAKLPRDFELEENKKELIIYQLYSEKNMANGIEAIKLENLTIKNYNQDYLAFKVKHYANTTIKMPEKVEVTTHGLKYRQIFADQIEEKDYPDYVLLDNRIIVSRRAIDDINTELKKTIMTPPVQTKFGERAGSYRHIEHYKYYLKYDCMVLRGAVEKFTGLIRDELHIEPYNYLTISSLAHNYALSRGCYNGVYSIFGNAQEFITKARYGGRVCTRDNERHIVVGEIVDDDGVSLYPTAIERLLKEYGIPACPFEIIDDTDHFNRLRVDPKTIYFFIEVKMHKNLKKQQLPFARVINKEGSYVNTHLVEGQTMHMGMIQFEDLVNMCEMCHHNKKGKDCDGSCYTFVQGMFWYDHDGKSRLRELGPLVSGIFDVRAKNKGNLAKSNALKLILNSIYGKNMQLSTPYTYKCVPVSKKKFYETKHYHRISSSETIGKTTVFKEHANSYYNANNIHIACMILEMSKRIMHEIMDIADEKGIVILYTDTDSLHIVNDKDDNGEYAYDKLCKEFKARYGRDLEGNRLGQFHNDFKMDNCENVRALKGYIIAKKVYAYYLEGTHKLRPDEKHYKWDYTFKGVNKEAVEEQIALLGGDPEDLFKALISGYIPIDFNLCAGGKASFDMRGEAPISRTKFIRTQWFGGDEDEKVPINYHGCTYDEIFGNWKIKTKKKLFTY
jgi:hypothetical protein